MSVSKRTNNYKKGAQLFFLIAGLIEFSRCFSLGFFKNGGNIVPLEAKNLKEAPTVYHGFLDLTRLVMVRFFLFKTVPHI